MLQGSIDLKTMQIAPEGEQGTALACITAAQTSCIREHFGPTAPVLTRITRLNNMHWPGAWVEGKMEQEEGWVDLYLPGQCCPPTDTAIHAVTIGDLKPAPKSILMLDFNKWLKILI